MNNKNNRILWLLNHKTLMHSEIPMLRSLGFEVYMPKIIPDDPLLFRSGAVDYSYDMGLTLPKAVLSALNSVDFYTVTWSPATVMLINTYFGTVFTSTLSFKESAMKFRGQIVLRAFGLQSDYTYENVLMQVMGKQLHPWLDYIKHRFWFGTGYTQVPECEPYYFQERSLFLPIPLHTDFWKHANTWHGTDKHILFVCPNITDGNPYYAKVYRQFKRAFGDLPHIIVGQQGKPVPDPHVLGYVSNDELISLYQKSAVLYYHSQEPRHVHYPPIEASIVGTPVIFYQNSLISRLLSRNIAGAAKDAAEARLMVEFLLHADQQTTTPIRNEQSIIPFFFTTEYCSPSWVQSLLSGRFAAALGARY